MKKMITTIILMLTLLTTGYTQPPPPNPKPIPIDGGLLVLLLGGLFLGGKEVYIHEKKKDNKK